jgi:hypothetical protein
MPEAIPEVEHVYLQSLTCGMATYTTSEWERLHGCSPESSTLDPYAQAILATACAR